MTLVHDSHGAFCHSPAAADRPATAMGLAARARLLTVFALLFATACTQRPSSAPVVAWSPDQATTGEDPRLTFATPFRNARPDVSYVGDEACSHCHATLADSYRQHPMGRSLTPMSSLAARQRYDKAAGNPFEQLGFQFLVERRGDRVFHKEQRRDSGGQVISELEAEVQFAVGSGAKGRSYLINHEGYLFQSPITWYSQPGIWDLSPGFTSSYYSQRPIEAPCLFCHCNRVEPVEHSVNRYQTPIFRGEAIGCERCHGPGELHVRRREQGEEVAGVDDTIVNPRRLEPSLRDAVCEQCHLQGEGRVLRRGRQTFDYRPGLPLHLFWTVLVLNREPHDKHGFVSHVEQMYGSRCYRESKGKMGCISCHDPHQLPAPEKRVAYYRDRCLSCHDGKPCSLSPEVRRQRDREDSCIACHMPRTNSSNIAHTAITDHRLLRRPQRSPSVSPPDAGGRYRGEAPGQLHPGEAPLRPFHRDAAGLEDRDVARDLAIALVQMARQETQASRPLGRLALPFLETAVQTWPDDVPSWEAKAYALWSQGRAEEALAAYETTLAKAPQRERALTDAALLSEQLRQEEAAIAYWRRALNVNPWLPRPHYRLSRLLAQRQQWQDAIEECEKAVGLSPATVETRMLLITCYVRSGNEGRARAEFEKVLALNPSDAEMLRRWFAEH